ncbi:DUF5712 family protein [Cytophagaceae bacterium YF14B1]|uniref:DUF5712 family protein n=1 Tax=Xanthocytophaga flava TaxID=3048013 RepID=A0AAE3QSK2_9BACT|nr:DUF5712 family protein [Xanthocytophaga flavus]MDJ1482638.1 DUF5712 family protein [Xanthocytophaga flavus]
MISKVLKAQSDGKPTSKAASKRGSVYDNKGSAARLVNYMEHEAKEQGETGAYFSQNSDEIQKQEVIAQIDGNVNGLKKEDSKFYSLIIAPSQTELSHIGSDSQTLKAYTRQVMENYAANFTFAGRQRVVSTDVLWFAIIHRERDYSGSDPMVREGKARSGERKKGDQTHIHIIVSRRDKAQTVNLTPTGAKTRFSIKSWQEKNAGDFQQLYGYTQQTHFPNDVYKADKLSERVQAFVTKHELEDYLSIDRIVSIGKEQDFGRIFYRNLNMLESSIEKGIRLRDPYSVLERRNVHKKNVKESVNQPDAKSERSLKKQIIRLRSDYLKEHGVVLTELDLPSELIKKVYNEHTHKWKFYQNLDILTTILLKSGNVPGDVEQQLSQLASSEEIELYIQSHKSKTKDQTQIALDTTSKKTSDPTRETIFENKLPDEIGVDSTLQSSYMARLSKLQGALQIASNTDGIENIEWGTRPSHKRKKFNRQNQSGYEVEK